MRIGFLPVILLLLFLGQSESLASLARIQRAIPIGSGRVLQTASSDLNGSGSKQTIAITCRTTEGGHPMGGDIIVLQEKNGKLSTIWRQRNLNPWKLQLADVDGDGKREIVVGVWKKSPLDPVMAKRTFVYSWNGERMLPMWLGSRLSRRFDDFTLADLNGDGWDELLAMEIAPGGKHRISAQRWSGFGFNWLGCSSEMKDLRSLRKHGNGAVTTKNGKLYLLNLMAGKIALTPSKGENDGHPN